MTVRWRGSSRQNAHSTARARSRTPSERLRRLITPRTHSLCSLDISSEVCVMSDLLAASLAASERLTFNSPLNTLRSRSLSALACDPARSKKFYEASPTMNAKSKPGKTGLRQKAQLMSPSEIERTLVRLAYEIVENFAGVERAGFVGIRPGGGPIAMRLGENITRKEKPKGPGGT